VVSVRSRGFRDGSAVRGAVDGAEGPDALAVPEGLDRADGAPAGAADGEATTHTSVTVRDGGRACVEPVSPEPQTHPSRSPSATVVDAAPVEDQVQPPCPSPRQ
jgi:hypothetical protein